MLISGLDKDADHYLVLGRHVTQQVGDIRRNPFGIAFQQAAERVGAKITLDNFEASIVQVKKDDLVSFLESLRMCL